MRATGTGSMPGSDFREATKVVVDTSGDLLAWPEVATRDVASSMISRALGLLEQPCNFTADGWRLASTRDAMQQRAARWWRNDLDDFEELTQDREGVLKVAFAGPWTLASQVRLAHPTMNHVLADQGACRDLGQALNQAISETMTLLGTRLGRRMIVQIDEPLVSAVLGGGLPTFSGLERYRVPDRDEVLGLWRSLVETALGVEGVAEVWLHSCAPGFDQTLVGRAGFTGLSAEARHLKLDDIAEWLDAGRTLALGVVRTEQPVVPTLDEITATALTPLQRLGVDAEMAQTQVVLTPACGLVGWTQPDAARVLGLLGEAGELVVERLRN